MRRLRKSAEAVGTVFGVLMGGNFTTPTERTLKEYPALLSHNARWV